MNNVVKNSKTSPKKSVTAKQLAKSNLTKRKNPDWDNLDRGYRYLTLDMKLPHDLAVAVMGNVVEESLGDYKASLKNGGGRGLIQWDGRKAPSGRYSLWGSIWASVAKPANVYDSTTDTVKNYWAPWGGLKGDKVRLKFIKAPLKEKARIYAESYLRPGKPRIADRQLSTMQLDSIYNPRIKDIIVLKNGGQIRKMLTAAGGPLNLSPEDIKRGANLIGEYFLKGLGAFGKIMSVPFISQGPTSANIYKSKELLAKERTIENKSEELLGKAMTWVSPLNYGAALATGNGLNARKGEEEVASWSPAWQAVGRLGELYVGPKIVKGVKAAPKTVVNVAAKAGVKPARAAVVAREIKLATKNKPNIEVSKPIIRTRVGDVEIDNPQLFYRQGSAEMGDDFIKSGVVKTSGGFLNPMYTEGALFKKIPTRTKGGLSKGDKIALEGPYNKTKSDLLVTDSSVDMIPADQGSGKNYTWFEDYMLDPFAEESIFDKSRVPLFNGTATSANTTAYRWEPGYGYKKVVQEPSTSLKFFERRSSKISEAERAGVPKGERNFKPKWHAANYPGYQLKSLMKGSPLEKQLSKNGTININNIKAVINKGSEVEKAVVNKVLREKFVGLKTIDYNKFKKAVLGELIDYSKKPLTKYSSYGMSRLGFEALKEPDGAGGILEYTPGVKSQTFTFESPRIPIGSSKHYDPTSLGHSRTYTTPEEPKILHVMESQSDWGQKKYFDNIPTSLNNSLRTIHENNALLRFEKLVPTQFKEEYSRFLKDRNIYGDELPNDVVDSYSEAFKEFVEDHLGPKISEPNKDVIYRWAKKYFDDSQVKYLHNNYLQRLLQENLKYAAENGLTKMRYSTPETAAKIEGYAKQNLYKNSEGKIVTSREALQYSDQNVINDLREDLAELASNLRQQGIQPSTNQLWIRMNTQLKELESPKLKEGFLDIGLDYPLEHQTILKKYADFPKLFEKLFKGLKVRIVKDSKGNTWYEVDVPKGYLSREWQFKKGGKMNILEFLKNGSGIHIKEKNKGKFTSYCGGKVTDECILKGKNSSNPAIRKRATFAANARKWKHEDGGTVHNGIKKHLEGGLMELLPIYGTIKSGQRFFKNPSWGKAAEFGLSAVGDALMFTGIGAGAGAAIKAGKFAAKAGKVAKTAGAFDKINAARTLKYMRPINGYYDEATKVSSNLALDALANGSNYEKAASSGSKIIRKAINADGAVNQLNTAKNTFETGIGLGSGAHYSAYNYNKKKFGGLLIKKHYEGAKLTFSLKLENLANSDLGKSFISNGLSFLSDKLFNKSASSNLEIALAAQEKELSTINPMHVAQMIEIAKNQYADPDNPNANGGDIFNNYIERQITAPILARQLEEHKKRLAAIDLLTNQAKSSIIGTFFNTLAQGGIEYLLNKYGKTEKADS